MTHSEANAILAPFTTEHGGVFGTLHYPDGLGHPVTILDVRSVFGRTDFLVAASTGETWVGADRVKPI